MTKRELCACVLVIILGALIFICETESTALYCNYAIEIPCALGLLAVFPFTPK